MDKQILDFVVEQTHALMAAPSCSQEAKAAAQAWLDAVGTDREAVCKAGGIRSESVRPAGAGSCSCR